MASATVYLVGSPVQDAADIRDLLQAVIPRQLGRKFKDFVIRKMRGPASFTSSWILESGVRPAERRPGLQGVDPWCVVCVWHLSGVVQVWTVGFLRFVEGSFLCMRPIDDCKRFALVSYP